MPRTREEIISHIKTTCKSKEDIKIVREQLNTLIDELKLSTNYPEIQITYPVEKVEGAWRQLWTDQEYPIPSFLKLDPERIFQVVSKDNHYWNLSDIWAFGIIPLSGCLRGKYEKLMGSPTVQVEFTKNGSRLFTLPSGNIVEYAKLIELGKKWILSFGKGTPPKGPIGIQGLLTSIYVDDEIRIDGGAQIDYKNEKNEVIVEGFTGTLFILEKVTNI
jgi:hypothetical protein